MKNFFAKWYATNLGRVIRRVVVAGLSAVIGYLMASGKLTLSPEGLVDSVLGLSLTDLVFSLKLFIGAGVLAGIDKMRREGTWNWLVKEPVDNSGEK